MRTKVLFLALLVLLTSAVSQVSRSDKKVVTSPEFPKPLGPYSHAVVAGGFVFVAGQGPINPKTQKMDLGDIKSEARLELTNISNILKAANLVRCERRGQQIVYMLNMSVFEETVAMLLDLFGSSEVATVNGSKSPPLPEGGGSTEGRMGGES